MNAPTRVFLIDDHRIVLDGLILFLSERPELEVVGEAGSGQRALELLADARADLVVMDLNLPDVDDLSLVKRIRSAWPSLKLIVLTGRSEGALVEEALVAGASGFLRKESATQLLLGAIGAALTGKTFLCPDTAQALADTLRRRHLAGLQGELSPQESRLLRGIAAGMSYKEMAEELNVTPKSVETYRRRLGKKLGLSTRAEFVRYAATKSEASGT